MSKIKSIIIATVVLIGLPMLESFSQTESEGKTIGLEDISFSFRGGLGVSNLAGATAGYSYRSGIAVLGGVYAEYSATAKSGLMAGIEYTIKGATIKTDDLFFYDNLHYDLSYVNFYMGGFHDLTQRLRLEAAIIPAIKASEEISYTGVYGYGGLSATTDNVRNMDLGTMAGFSYQFTKINFGVHYTYGLMDINKNQSEGVSSLQNRMLMFSLKYVLDI
ncbi:outer membrane beta-barrel protein [uncultured Cyclobacterium sp.]|uniref:outer membrane beta-barrel protein n=1 Tax=uncultured Cyclobacterium sp. TaxID=453820 RepID=UPI0030EB62C9